MARNSRIESSRAIDRAMSGGNQGGVVLQGGGNRSMFLETPAEGRDKAG